MPTYEFRCPAGHDFEKFYRTISNAESQAACPVCGETAGRIMSATGFAFKGSGFYLTDYGKDAHRKKGPADGKTDSATSAPSGSSSSGSGEGSSSSASGSESKSGGESKPAESKPAPASAKPSSSE